jgi:hypothetical protein
VSEWVYRRVSTYRVYMKVKLKHPLIILIYIIMKLAAVKTHNNLGNN